MGKPQSYRDELDKIMWTTKGARYNGSRRCKRKHEVSTASTAILTLYIIGFSIAQYVPSFNIQKHICGYITYSTIVASIGILILSLLEGSKNYQVKSERLYNCANEINNLYSTLRSLHYDNSLNETKVMEIRNGYTELLLRYPDNHDPIDFELFKAQYKQEFDISYSSSTWIKMKSMIQMYWLYTALLIAPVLVFIFFFI